MFKHKFMAIVFSLSVLGSLQNVRAVDPSNLAEEVEHYLKWGLHSKNFYPNIIEGQDEETKKTKETLLELKKKEPYSYPYNYNYYLPEKKQRIVQAWLDLANNESDDPTAILYLSKSLSVEWNSTVALQVADKCHSLASSKKHNPKEMFMLAYRGFENLRVNLAEPDYDYHKKLAAAPQVIALLEDLKIATESLKSVKKLPCFVSPKLFNENCIPQAQVCTLLTVAYAADILLGLEDTNSAQLNIFENGKKALQLYQKGLEGPSTLDQRKYYYTQIVNLVLGFSRTPRLVGPEVDPYVKLAKKSALELARISKDAHKESQGLQACCLAYDTALNYAYAGKRGKALKYIEIVSKSPVNDSLHEHYNDIRVHAENLRLQLEGSSSEAFWHQLQNSKVFWK